METIQIVLDSKLLQAADRAARKNKVNRSALIRDAIRAHLKKLATRELEERERKAYQAKPQTEQEFEIWEQEAAWPKE